MKTEKLFSYELNFWLHKKFLDYGENIASVSSKTGLSIALLERLIARAPITVDEMLLICSGLGIEWRKVQMGPRQDKTFLEALTRVNALVDSRDSCEYNDQWKRYNIWAKANLLECEAERYAAWYAFLNGIDIDDAASEYQIETLRPNGKGVSTACNKAKHVREGALKKLHSVIATRFPGAAPARAFTTEKASAADLRKAEQKIHEFETEEIQVDPDTGKHQ